LDSLDLTRKRGRSLSREGCVVHAESNIQGQYPPIKPYYKLATTENNPSIDRESVEMLSHISHLSASDAVEAKSHPKSKDMMTTRQLTGRCFITRRNVNSNAFECTHIQPSGFVDGCHLESFLQ